MARTVAGAAPSRTNRRFLIIAVLLAVVSAVLVYANIASEEEATSGRASAGTRQVVVAKAEIPINTVITSEMLEIQTIPINGVALDAISDPANAVGKVTKYPITANGQIAASAILDTTRPAGALSDVVPVGRRAISVQASQVFNAGGLVLPGDYVDVVWACCNSAGQIVITKTLLRNVQVVSVQQTLVPSAPVAGSEDPPVPGADALPVPDAGTVTLLLTPEQAQIIFFAEMNGTLRVALRGDSDDAANESGSAIITDVLTAEEIARLEESLRPAGTNQ